MVIAEEPQNINEALNGQYADQWKEAAENEFNSLIANGTWDLVDLPENKKLVGSKWVFKIKHDSNGQVDRFKARLVAQGLSQKHGIDYNDVFAPGKVYINSLYTCHSKPIRFRSSSNGCKICFFEWKVK